MDQILGWTATFLFSIMIIPQIYKTLRTKTIEGVSFILFIINLLANIIALTYALLIHQYPLVIKYVIAIITTTIYIGVYIWIKLRNTPSKDKSLK